MLSRTLSAEASRRKGWKRCASCSAAMPAPRLVTAMAMPSGARSRVPHVAAHLAVAHGVGQQIVQDLIEALWVGARGGERAVLVDHDMAIGRRGSGSLRCGAHVVLDVERPRLDVQLAALDARDVEQVPDDAIEALRAASDDLRRPTQMLLVAAKARESPDGGHDCAQRLPQLVCDDGRPLFPTTLHLLHGRDVV